MYWINSGTYSVKEVQDTFDVDLDIVNVKEFNEGKGRDYDYWDSIIHPETGEKLVATQGYMDHNSNKCYYAEYRSESGKYYNYTAGLKGESIQSQQRQDNESINKSDKYAEARKRFSSMMNGEKTVENKTEHLDKQNDLKNNNDRS